MISNLTINSSENCVEIEVNNSEYGFLALLFTIYRSAAVVLHGLALAFCYFYLKKQDTRSFLDGYIVVFKTFAEFTSAAVCVTYGLIEMDFRHLAGGACGIVFGFVVRAIMYFADTETYDIWHDTLWTVFIMTVVSSYILTVYLCSSAFYKIAVMTGTIPCATGIITCVLPMVALSESIKFRTANNFVLCNTVDFIGVILLSYHCSQVPIKYVVILPNIVAMILISIQKVFEQAGGLPEPETAKERTASQMQES